MKEDKLEDNLKVLEDESNKLLMVTEIAAVAIRRMREARNMPISWQEYEEIKDDARSATEAYFASLPGWIKEVNTCIASLKNEK